MSSQKWKGNKKDIVCITKEKKDLGGKCFCSILSNYYIFSFGIYFVCVCVCIHAHTHTFYIYCYIQTNHLYNSWPPRTLLLNRALFKHWLYNTSTNYTLPANKRGTCSCTDLWNPRSRCPLWSHRLHELITTATSLGLQSSSLDSEINLLCVQMLSPFFLEVLNTIY